MAFLDGGGTRIYWDEEGSGPPLLLIMGLSYAAVMWHRTRPRLSAHYRTIAFDNRGSGRSDVPKPPYSMEQMARDAAAVLDAASVSAAHVYGMSMGGMIAQEFALRYPHRVLSLVLACTSPGGPNSVPAEPAARDLLMARAKMTPEQAAEASVPFIYAPGTPRKRIDEDLALRLASYPRPEGYIGQLQAILAWEAYSRLPQIHAPTLVLHGECDRLIPVRNAELIADRIRGAKLVILPGASHLFATDQPEPAHEAVVEFLGARAQAGVVQ